MQIAAETRSFRAVNRKVARSAILAMPETALQIRQSSNSGQEEIVLLTVSS
jgi:hypothetical protein